MEPLSSFNWGCKANVANEATGLQFSILHQSSSKSVVQCLDYYISAMFFQRKDFEDTQHVPFSLKQKVQKR